ncbi:hypothetical protein NQD34_012224 [Periophthalmus magnuspinnatus]|uniref:uncharacterized protein si:ch211-197h24.6 n=1 Tax=Periophthalmus magnuspinnatus TaxID=409849 RepID=UPI00145A4496|nr:uncharacterized protein si:ch211-197h24.6 [Periophthalmus magnuspinnatus]KAJ0000382.1 hypothetical protein NQD34_012224 [Periophthalmus magnuspinnatus]
MDPMSAQAYAPQAAKRKFPFGQPQNQGKRGKAPNRQPLQHSDEIVYTKGSTIHSMPSLGKRLKELTGVSVIGLQYVWEYRSPSKSLPPHYHCKLCNVIQVQTHMFEHIKGWKHSFRYIKKVHPDKVPFEEEAVHKDQTLKQTIKDNAVEIENTEGRGQLKVILKEPSDVPAFKGFYSANPGTASTPAKTTSFGPKLPRGGYRMEGFGGYPSLQAPPLDYTMDHFHDMGHDQMGDEYGAGDFDGYEPSSDYTDEYRDRHMDRPLTRPSQRPLPRPMNPTLPPPRRPANSNGGDLSGTLLSYLDTFKIENEGDAQLVLKVTQKLTDVLMEYRLRRVEGPTVPSVFPPSAPTIPSRSEQYTGYQSLSRYSDAPSRYYN